MSWYKNLFKKYCSGVDMIFRIVCQISGQDNVSCKIQTHIGIFRSKVFVSVFQSEQKVIVEIFVLRGFCNNCAANRKSN